MNISSKAVAQANEILSEGVTRETLELGLSGSFTKKNVLILIPDATRTLPLSMLFQHVVEVLHDTRQLDFMVALGTHPPLNKSELLQLVGITEDDSKNRYKHVGLFNHEWDNPQSLTKIGNLSQMQVRELVGDDWHYSLGGDVPILINRHVLKYDHIIILGPTFPHEVVGFSGGAKYLFPGISGAEMIHMTHWLSALKPMREIIGTKDTPIRALIHQAVRHVPIPITLVSMVVVDTGLAGMFIGSLFSAWEMAADLSSKRHIRWLDKPVKRVLSCPSLKYTELWTASKAMYKLEAVVEDGGEVIVYAPHLETVSETHGEHIYQIGYHVCDYFLKQWERFKNVPRGVLGHSVHLRGEGHYENGAEHSRIKVTLATKISIEDCAQLSLGYINPEDIIPKEWQEKDDVLYVENAGEILYQLRP